MANEKSKRTWIIIAVALLAIAVGVLVGYLVWGNQNSAQPGSKAQTETAVTEKAATETVPQAEEAPQQETAGQAEPAQADGNAEAAVPLSEYWSADSAAAQSLRDFVAKVTNPDDPASFIPEKDRIAVFDMDGTLACETYYTYYDTMMFIEYCLNDHPDRVSDELKQVAVSHQTQLKNSLSATGPRTEGGNVGSAAF